MFERAYRDVLRSAPDLYGGLYERWNKPEPGRQRNLFEKLNTRPILKLLDEFRPDLVISTHGLPTGVISWLREKKRLHTPHAVVVAIRCNDFPGPAYQVDRRLNDSRRPARRRTNARRLSPPRAALDGVRILRQLQPGAARALSVGRRGRLLRG